MTDSRSPIMASLEELKTHWKSRLWWRERIRDRINAPIQQRLRPRDNAINIVEEEWDTLIVLDACRADLFDEVVDPATFDETTTVTSPGSFTREWLTHTFDDNHGDIVYVTGNPMVSDQKPDCFHSIVEAWRTGWDPKEKIVRPEAVTEAAIQARDDFPHKRLIVHYMQPHAPFIDHPDLNFWADLDDIESDLDEGTPRTETDDRIDDVWDALAVGLVDVDEVWEGYVDTLQTVIEEVDVLLDSFTDRIVVTSDHGNLVGERGWPIPVAVYGHPANQRLSNLIRVPWAVVEGDRRKIVAGDVRSESDASEREVWDQLAYLGYAEE